MKKFRLELFLKIVGIGSASGLFLNGNSLYLISDNSNMLYEYHIEEKKLDKIPLLPSEPAAGLENIDKADKPDYEAITAHDGDLYLFGSGSTDKRNDILPINMATKEVKKAIDATDLYIILREFGEIDMENFNIEAAVNDGDTWYIFNRGNGPKGSNGIFILTGDMETTEFQIMYNEIKLPKINNAPTSFTDAVIVGSKIYFLAAAEAGNSTYHDGEVAGSVIGRLDIDKMKVEKTQVVSTQNKFEGITLYKNSKEEIAFLLCEDTDSDKAESDIFMLTITK